MESEKRDVTQAIMRGLFHKCPNCGHPSIYKSYLKVKDCCETCDLALNDYSADDFPPYVVMSLVGTIIVPLVFLTDYLYDISEFTLMAIWLPLSILFILAALPPAKGAILGALWALDIKKEVHR